MKAESANRGFEGAEERGWFASAADAAHEGSARGAMLRAWRVLSGAVESFIGNNDLLRADRSVFVKVSCAYQR